MYFQSLNFIRFILAIGVLLYHNGVNFYPFNIPEIKSFIQNSGFRVSFFFFISGFVMYLVYGHKIKQTSIVFFYKKRLTRILPMYWLAFIATLLLVVFVNHASPKGLSIILQFLGLQSWNPGFVLDLNFTTWSISVELFFYLLFPFLARIIFSWSIKKTVIVSVLVWLLQTIQHIIFIDFLFDTNSKVIEEFINAFPLWHLATFFAGMCTYKLISEEAFSNLFKKNAWLFFILSILLLFLLIEFPTIINKYIHNGLLAPIFALIIVSLFYDKTIITRVFSNKYLSSLGSLSYGIFIFQYPIWLIFIVLFTKQQSEQTWFFYLYFVTVLLISKIAYNFFEKPMLNFFRKIFN